MQKLKKVDVKFNEATLDEINWCVVTFYKSINRCQMKNSYELMSPNMRQLALVERHIEKYQQALLFGREIVGYKVYQLSEVYPGTLEAFVAISLKPYDQKENGRNLKKKKSDGASLSTDELMYRAYKFRFIEIDGAFYIDDINLYNEFWGNEFKAELQQE